MNKNGQVISIINQFYDLVNKTYKNSNKTEFTYNALGNVETEIYLIKVHSTQFQATQRFVYTYDASGNIIYTEVANYDLNGIYHLCEEQFSQYYFDNNNKLVKKLLFIDGGSSRGTLNSRISYIYNTSGRLEREIHQQNNNQVDLMKRHLNLMHGSIIILIQLVELRLFKN